MGELVDHRQNPKRSPTCCYIRHEVIAPNVVGSLSPQTNTRPIVEPQPAPFWLFLRYFQPSFPPQPFHTLVINLPAFPPQQRGDPTIPIPTVHTGQLYHSTHQRWFI